MTVDLVIRNGRVVTPGGVIGGGVAIEGERIVAVGADATLPPARRTIDAREQYVIPGLIDAHVHMGSEEDASIAEGLARNMPVETDGALHGGVTTFAHFVGQRNEPLVPNIETTIREGNRWSRVDYFFHAIVSTDGHHAELPAVWDLGVTSFKHFFNAYKPRPTEGLSWLGGPSDAGMLLRSLRFCAERGAPGICIVHCEDIDVVAVLEDELMAAGRTDLGAWSDARPNVAEYSRIAMAIDLARTARAPIYIAHMSTARGRRSRRRRPARRLAGVGGGDAASPDAYRDDGGGGRLLGQGESPAPRGRRRRAALARVPRRRHHLPGIGSRHRRAHARHQGQGRRRSTATSGTRAPATAEGSSTSCPC